MKLFLNLKTEILEIKKKNVSSLKSRTFFCKTSQI